MANILIVDNNEKFSNIFSNMVREMKHHPTSVHTLQDGLAELQTATFDVVFLNAQLPDGNALDVLPEILQIPSLPEIIVMSDVGDPDEAEHSIKLGAWDYIEKPSSVIRNMILPLVRALQYRQKKKVEKPSVSFEDRAFGRIIGNSPQMKICKNLLAHAASSDANVLITGDTGTGKELFALAIHNNSARAEKNFVVVDCAALPQTLVESMLFGHKKGAFTGANRDQNGLIRQADSGTLFLDEVGELPLSVQKSFLRVLQERRFRPIGGAREIESDFRLIVASNRDLDNMVQRKKFREDLLFRLRAFTIELPPLKDHIEDIKELATYYMSELCDQYGIAEKAFSPEFFDVLAAYSWPGNVRELIHAMERALAAARDEPVIFPKHLPNHVRAQIARDSVSKEPANTVSPRNRAGLPRPLPKLQDVREASIADAEQHYLKELMSVTKSNIKEACRISGLSRSRLYALLKKYQISQIRQ